MTYRVFLGMWNDGDPEWTHVDMCGLTWEQAKSEVQKRLDSFRDEAREFCEHCALSASEDLARLAIAEPGQFEAEIEGDDLLILVE